MRQVGYLLECSLKCVRHNNFILKLFQSLYWFVDLATWHLIIFRITYKVGVVLRFITAQLVDIAKLGYT
jgi:hypothetical protein